jgi:hypothetical protein
MSCLLVVTIAAATTVYGPDHHAPIDVLGPGDHACVLEIEASGWQLVHWARYNIGRGGWIHNTIRLPAEPYPPLPRDEFEPPVPIIPPEPLPGKEGVYKD